MDVCSSLTLPLLDNNTSCRYHEIFRLLFTPSKALAEHIDSTMKSLELTPKQYSSAHLRVKYPMKRGMMKEEEFSYKKHKHQIQRWATNAVNCAVQLHPHATIYVSSDNNDTIGYLVEESKFAKHLTNAMRNNTRPLVKLVARDFSKENEHFQFSSNRDVDEFMSVFEDLLIMGMGKCVASGFGGYGRLGADLSGGECVMLHRGSKSKTCPNPLAKMG